MVCVATSMFNGISIVTAVLVLLELLADVAQSVKWHFFLISHSSH